MANTRVHRSTTAALFVAVALVTFSQLPGAFVTGSRGAAQLPARVAVSAEGAPSPAPAPESVALVKVDDESMETTAGLLGGLAGLLVGGFWIGAAGFAVTSYLAKKEGSDLSTGLKGLSKGLLEGLNFGNYVNSKYSVTTQVGGALNEALEKNVKSDQKASITSAYSTAAGAVESLDKDIDLKKTFGEFATAAADVASQAVEKAIEFNEKNKVTDKIAEKVSELASKAQKKDP